MAFFSTMLPLFEGVPLGMVLSSEQYGRSSLVCRFLLTGHLLVPIWHGEIWWLAVNADFMKLSPLLR